MKLDHETPIMTQFGVDTSKHDALFKAMCAAQDDAAVAKQAWTVAQRRVDEAQIELEKEIRVVHEHLLKVMRDSL